jgi:hypothetical protein
LILKKRAIEFIQEEIRRKMRAFRPSLVIWSSGLESIEIEDDSCGYIDNEEDQDKLLGIGLA